MVVTNSIIMKTAGVFLLAIFSRSMINSLEHYEHMNLRAGALMAQGKVIYKDFSIYPMAFDILRA